MWYNTNSEREVIKMDYLPNIFFGILTLVNLCYGFGLLEYHSENDVKIVGSSGMLCLINTIVCLYLTLSI